jgi:pimeloyl-ACP methyl ester carboxylesterase
MDEEDLRRFRALAPQAQYQRITSGHMIHFEKPKEYRRVVTAFADRLVKK